ncbi:chemotaxis protein CheY [Clostridium homopropionicum DSM 5847]|uniref:Chemotaxis protein CheY n=1 Tax=Clostridium homopropionicum DSM 5847 TaxID=1121318 RepID=A0A0L6Z5R6_9CLOT|nr:response regulator [Clostridium homopropionicum]KOA18310.1 chemotaxis protein CheY [Clostridium homopropionicum DSM 5847]SFF69363.1 CheY chemotaxis protein or a CheY-like REC (receiver) domain [Clostridium homopropionicum]
MDKILVINDCRLEEVIMKDILVNEGYQVKIDNEYGAISSVKDFLPNTVIVNLIMRETTGDKLISRIKGINNEIKCILSSSNLLQLEDFSENKVDAVIKTPIERESLLKAVKDPAKAKLKAKFCINCGTKIEKEIEFRAKFCPDCGEKL